jgi:hypothetical protein
MVFDLSEASADGWVNSKNIKIVSRNATGMNILDTLASLKVYAGRNATGDCGDKGRNVIAQQFPLFSVDVLTAVECRGTLHVHEDGADPVWLEVRKTAQHQSVHNG